MKIQNKAKRTYTVPLIEQIQLDNEISLALESNPAAGPDEVRNNKAPEHFNIDPFKAKQG